MVQVSDTTMLPREVLLATKIKKQETKFPALKLFDAGLFQKLLNKHFQFRMRFRCTQNCRLLQGPA